jgi:outer membrane beta-barrel protein
MKKLSGLLLLLTTAVAVSSEKSVYDFSWLDKDKEIYVLQNRKFRKAKTMHVGGTLGRSLSGAFNDRISGSVYGGFFFTEDFGLELSYTKASNTTNATHDAVKKAGTVAFYRQIDSELTAHFVWAPFYSKINTFNKIVYYDWLFGLGASTVSTEDNRNEFNTVASNKDDLTAESNFALTWFTGFRFYINQNWSTRIDFKGTHSNADRAIADGTNDFKLQKSWFNYYDLKLGLNYSF